MKETLVTVVIPVYGVEKYLDRCISSVVDQTYQNLDIILVDDGSKDRCPQMCDSWAENDSRIRVIHKKNAGLGMARNTGIENARGEYICFFDSDDYIEKDTIEKALKLAKSESADIVLFGFQDVDADGKILGSFKPTQSVISFSENAVQEKFLPDLIDPRHEDAAYPGLILSACCCIFAMDLVRNTGWKFVSERENISEDSYSLIWLYRYVKKVAILPEIKYCYCKNSTSLTQTYHADRFERIKDFYRDTLVMAEKQCYDRKIKDRIGGLFLSFSIAAIKQIVVSEEKFFEKRKLLKKILADKELQQVLHNPESRYRSRSRKVLIRFMKKQNTGMVYFLAMLQNSRA